jgi:TATA-binding protein-associated factor
MAVPTLPRDWITTPFLRLLFQNLVVEEREDIREATLSAWRSAISILSGIPGLLDTTVDQKLIFEWFAVMMTPLGMAIDASSFYHAHVTDQVKNANGGGAGAGTAAASTVGHERHNVDKNMLTQDLSLITIELTLRARVAAATAIAYAIAHWPQGVSIACLVSIKR